MACRWGKFDIKEVDFATKILLFLRWKLESYQLVWNLIFDLACGLQLCVDWRHLLTGLYTYAVVAVIQISSCEMIYMKYFIYIKLRMWNQVSYDPRSYERNLCNCVYRSLKKSGLQRGLNPWPRDTGETL